MFISTFPKYLLPLTFSPNGWILYQLAFMYYVENHKEILVSKPKKKNWEHVGNQFNVWCAHVLTYQNIHLNVRQMISILFPAITRSIFYLIDILTSRRNFYIQRCWIMEKLYDGVSMHQSCRA